MSHNTTERGEVAIAKLCPHCMNKQVCEIIEIVTISARGNLLGGTHRFHITGKSIGHACEHCRTRFELPPTTDESKLRKLAYYCLAKNRGYQLKESFDVPGQEIHLKKGAIVYEVPVMSGSSSSRVEWETVDLMDRTVTLEPGEGASRFQVPSILLEKM